MISKLTNLVAWVLALNFLFAAGGVGYLVATKKLDKAKVQEIRQLILAPATQPTTQPATQPTTQKSPDDAPMSRLDAVVQSVIGKPADEQSKTIQIEVGVQAAMLERRSRELEDQQRQIDLARAEIENDRKKLADAGTQLETKQTEQAKLAEDVGFQETLALYTSMQPKRAKELMKSLTDDVLVRYLRAMETRKATNILKEFKTPDEVTRAQAIMERMRQAQAEAN